MRSMRQIEHASQIVGVAQCGVVVPSMASASSAVALAGLGCEVKEKCGDDGRWWSLV